MNHSTMTVANYFAEVYLPANVDRWSQAKSYETKHRLAITQLTDYAERELTMGELTPALLAEFGEWMAAKGISAVTTTQRILMLSAIGREFDFDLFPPGYSASTATIRDPGMVEADNRGEAMRGKPLPPETAITDATPLYHLEHKHGAGTRSRLTSIVNNWDRLTGGKTIASITAANLEAYEQLRLQSGAVPDTVTCEVRRLRALAKWAAEYPNVVGERAVKKAPRVVHRDSMVGEVQRYLDTRYAKSKSLSDNTIRNHTAAIYSFSEFIGKAADFADLKEKAFREWLDNLGKGRNHYPASLLALWRDAAQASLTRWPSITLDSEESIEPRDQYLMTYFAETYLPERKAEGDLKPNTVRTYRYAVNKFAQFTSCGPASKIKNIHPQKLRKFREWLEECNVAPRKAKAMAEVIRGICRRAYPAGWLPKQERTSEEVLSDDTLASVVVDRYLPVRTNIASDNTVDKYHNAIRRFSQFLGHTATLKDLTDHNLGSFMRSLTDIGRSARTANGYRAKILALWNWCAKQKLVDKFPTLPKMAEPEQIPEAWGEDDMRALLKACGKMTEDVCDVRADKLFRAYVLLVWDTAERAGAVFQLRWEWIDLDLGHMAIPAGARKGGQKAMFYTLKPATVAALEAILKPSRELVFQLPKDGLQGRDWFYRRWRRLLKFAGLPYVPHKSGPQKIRRSVASHLEAAGGNATRFLAHSQRALTEKSYLDPRIVGTPPGNELLFDIDGDRTKPVGPEAPAPDVDLDTPDMSDWL